MVRFYKNCKNSCIHLILFLIIHSASHAQQFEIMNHIRKPYVAGQFYPANPESLKSKLSELFIQSQPKKYNNVAAIISPHAGYVFSGSVAASAFNQIDTNKEYEHIFIIASSHISSFNGASIYTGNQYITPLGGINCDTDLAKKLINDHPFFSYNSFADSQEHSIEVQLPFLQHLLKKITIVPIIIGTNSPELCEKIALVLKPFFNTNNLFIISTDFAHYPSYNQAIENDKRTSDAISLNSASEFLKTIDRNKKLKIPNLATSICGWTSVLTLLYLTQANEDYSIKSIDYKNSGDSRHGEQDQVVGYCSMAVVREKKREIEFKLSETDKTKLLQIARKTLETYIVKKQIPTIDTAEFSKELLSYCGAFVSLHKKGNLRGCIGRFSSNEPLFKTIQAMTISAASQDNRFSPVSSSELKTIDIEISVLTPMKRIYSIDEFELGKHGIYIKKGNNSGTFLPQVAASTGWSKEEFIGHCSQDKAGLGWNGWKEAELYTYEAIVFGE